jgi:hypothetical protein
VSEATRSQPGAHAAALAHDAVAACAQLIRFDTTNHGGGEASGEREDRAHRARSGRPRLAPARRQRRRRSAPIPPTPSSH